MDSLAGFVASIAYKPGWRFKLAGPGSRWLCVFAETVDSQAMQRTRITQHQFEFPDPLPDDRRDLCRWVLERMLDIERHETTEFLRFSGVAPFFPNHQDEGSPYEHVERWETPVMTLRPIRPGLRTIHNGSAFVAKANIIVPPNGELTVPEDVADQLQRDGAFKDGPAPEIADIVTSAEVDEAEIADVQDEVVATEAVPDAAEEPEAPAGAKSSKRAKKA